MHTFFHKTFLAIFIPELSLESAGIKMATLLKVVTLFRPSIRLSVCHVLLSKTAVTSYKPAN